MKNSEQLTPAAAAVTALSTLLCCVPTSFAAALATTGTGLFVAEHQGWFLAASVVLIGIGMLQLRSARRSCSTTRRRVSAILLGASAVIVAATVLFPQVLAGFMADWLG